MNLFNSLTCPLKSVPPAPSIISLTPCRNVFQENVYIFPGLSLPEQMWFSGAISSGSLPYPRVNLLNSSHPFGLFPPSYIQRGSKVFCCPRQNEASLLLCHVIGFISESFTFSPPLSPLLLLFLNYRYTAKLSGCKRPSTNPKSCSIWKGQTL